MGIHLLSGRLISKMNCFHLKLVLCALLAAICFNQVTCGLTSSSTTLAPECGANSGENLIGRKDVLYRGCQTQTRSGYECQKWGSQNPHSHKYTPEAYPDSGLVKNYCRNPSGSDTIWCYTTDPNKRWEYCDPLGAEWRDIVANEAQLTNTCTGTCDSVGILDHDPNWLKKNCKVVKDCQLMSTGYNKGFVRCDYCKCRCQDSRETIPATVEIISKKQVTEAQLGTCTNTCDDYTGLVKTKFMGCDELRDCYKSRSGWLRGFVKCDYCLCTCVNHKFINSYKMVNVQYNTDAANLQPAVPDIVASVVVQNEQNMMQEISHPVTYETTSSSSWESSVSVSAGVSITVEAGVDVGVASASQSVTASLEVGYETRTGEAHHVTKTSSLEAKMKVPAKMQCEAQIVGTKRVMDIPYSATIIEIYDDGTEGRRRRIEGIFTDLETRDFRVIYKECTPCGTVCQAPLGKKAVKVNDIKNKTPVVE